jgi:glutamyl-tRNA synthetase
VHHLVFLHGAAMPATLNLSSTLSPFPFAAAAIAAYTGKVELKFEDSTNQVTFDLDGSVTTEEDLIVQEIAKTAGVSDDNAKVWEAFIFF